jgi:hypothetical protein
VFDIFEDLSCLVIGGIILLALLLLVICVIASIAVVAFVTG